MRPTRFFLLILLAAVSMWAQSTPVPFVSQPLVPTSVAPDAPGFTLTVNGTGFVSGSVVNWNGSPRSTQFVSKSQLRAAISAADVEKAGTASVSVTNPGAGNLVSNVTFFSVVTPVTKVAFSGSEFSTSAANPSAVAVADFNGDGIPDLAATNDIFIDNVAHSTVVALLGNGDGTFRQTDTQLAGVAPDGVLSGDFNGDGKPDLIVLESDGYLSKNLSFYAGHGDGTFEPAVTSMAGAFQQNAVAGDFNGDGKLDLAVAEYNYVAILLGNGDGTFTSHQMIYNLSWGICAGDFNGDGILDLAVASSYEGEPPRAVKIFLGQGDGTFKAGEGYSAEQDATAIATADLNGDGVLDLVVGSTSGATVLLGNGDGTFGASVTYPTSVEGGHPVTIADFNGDGIPDIALADDAYVGGSIDQIAILLGKGDGTFLPAEYFQGGLGDYNLPLLAGDFNGDGAMDLVLPAGGANVIPGYGYLALQTSGPAELFSFSDVYFTSVQLLGTQSAAQSVTMTNVGKKRLDIAHIGMLGTNPRDFVQSNDCGSSLSVGSTCNIDVTFTPKDRGARGASLTVTANTAPSQQSIPLYGVGGSVTLLPSSLSFGSQPVGTVSAAQAVTLTNIAKEALTISQLGFIGQFPGAFLQTNDCGTMVAPGASCTVNVQFAPPLKRAFDENFGVTDNGGGQIQTIPVSGTGT